MGGSLGWVPPTPSSPSDTDTNSSFHQMCLQASSLRQMAQKAKFGCKGYGRGGARGRGLVKETGRPLASFLPQLSAPSCVSMSTRQMGHFLLMASHWSTHSWWKRCIQGRRLEKRRVRLASSRGKATRPTADKIERALGTQTLE